MRFFFFVVCCLACCEVECCVVDSVDVFECSGVAVASNVVLCFVGDLDVAGSEFVFESCYLVWSEEAMFVEEL